jgi:superfamily II DNA helicase RecQ
MDIQDKLVKIITIIQEAGQGLTREQLQNILVGTPTENPELDQLESFGIAIGTGSDDWNTVFNIAMSEGFLKIKNQKAQTLTYTPEGKKFRKKPHAISVNGNKNSETEITSPNPTISTSERSKRQIKLIQTIDRKIALDDFAENENIDLDDVLDDLEALLAMGKRMDITYFVNEIINPEDIAEVKDSLPSGKFDMKTMTNEWGDVYNEQELRLLRYILS